MIKTLCLGGSFNPIHHAHLICARAAAEFGGFDEVLLIPSSQPPHKPDSADLAAAADRLAMARLAAESSSGFKVDGTELERSGPSYTIDTVREFKRRGWSEVHWLIGADMLAILPSWREADKLLEEVTFHVLERPGHAIDWAALPLRVQDLRQSVVTAPLIEISATNIRARVRAGLSIDYLTPPAVVDFIRKRQLYRAGGGSDNETSNQNQ